MRPDPDAITTFLTRLYDTDHNLERELSWSDPGQDAIIHAERFAADDPVGFAARAAEINEAGCNVYFAPALLEPGGHGRARDNDVAAVGVLWTDLDTADAMRAPAKRYGVCEPTCSVMTRPPADVRLHYYWRLAEPIFGAAAPEAKRLNRRIAAHMYGDLACCNPSRVLRVPHTIRHPTEDKPIGPYLLNVCWFGEGLHTYTPGEIEAAFPVVVNGARDYGVSDNCTPKEEWVTIAINGAREGERNQTAARLFGYLLRRDVYPEVAWPLVSSWNTDRCEPPLDEDELERVFHSICERELDRRFGT